MKTKITQPRALNCILFQEQMKTRWSNSFYGLSLILPVTFFCMACFAGQYILHRWLDETFSWIELLSLLATTALLISSLAFLPVFGATFSLLFRHQLTIDDEGVCYSLLAGKVPRQRIRGFKFFKTSQAATHTLLVVEYIDDAGNYNRNRPATYEQLLTPEQKAQVIERIQPWTKDPERPFTLEIIDHERPAKFGTIKMALARGLRLSAPLWCLFMGIFLIIVGGPAYILSFESQSKPAGDKPSTLKITEARERQIERFIYRHIKSWDDAQQFMRITGGSLSISGILLIWGGFRLMDKKRIPAQSGTK